jgi:hypothetical protein
MKKIFVVVSVIVAVVISAYSYHRNCYTQSEALELATRHIENYCDHLDIAKKDLSKMTLSSTGRYYHDIQWTYINGGETNQLHAIFDKTEWYFRSSEINSLKYKPNSNQSSEVE